VSQHIIIPVAPEDWLLQNHRVHYQVAARKKKQIRMTLRSMRGVT
jgi:hypothetical protein